MVINNSTLYMIRTVYGFSCVTTGDLLGVSSSLVSLVERGLRTLTPELRRRIVDGFELNDAKLKRIRELYYEMEADSKRRTVFARVSFV